MLIVVSRPALRYWFLTTAGDSSCSTYLYLMYGVYDPVLREITGHTCGTCFKAGRAWVSLGLFEPKTRRTKHAASLHMLSIAKARHQLRLGSWDPGRVLRTAGPPMPLVADSIVEAAEEALCK